MKNLFRLMLHPKPELARLDTGLRFTDILFGFVIREIFLRLQYWQNLPRDVSMHLAACAALVLGSWIGYRRSLNRSAYEVKFFNLPFFRFLLDQGMLILYFQMASLTPSDLGKPTPDPAAEPFVAPISIVLASGTAKLILYTFVLYFAWDALGIWMAASKTSGKPRYPDVRDNAALNDNNLNNAKMRRDWAALMITGVFLMLFANLWLALTDNSLTPTLAVAIAIVLLLAYRLVKETKTSWLQS